MLYPLKFKPLYKERLWGGDKLAKVMLKQLPRGKKIGESWEISGLKGDLSKVSEGMLKDNTIEEMTEIFMGELVGDRIYQQFGIEFPLLVKYLDSNDHLSIQVHPHDELAKDRHHSYGKTELWYVIDAEEGSYIYLGLQDGVTEDLYLDHVAGGTVHEILNKIEVEPGDAFFIPAGTIHALGKGIVIAEIQQVSDITYRIFDWDRVDAEGKMRPLHTELALEAINFGTQEHEQLKGAFIPNHSTPLKKCPHFDVSLLEMKGEAVRDYSTIDSFVIYMCIEGSCTLQYDEGETGITKGETILIPAQENNITLQGEAKIIEVYINLLK